MKLSIIVPLYNEEESLGVLYNSIRRAVDPLALIYEIILIDDGSQDQTFERAKELAANDHVLRLIRFRKNYGQTQAMSAGIDHARGEIVVTMDGDLQNDPSDIANLLAKIEDGYDIAVGWRHKRKDKLITRKIPSRIANWLIGKVTGVPIKDNGCSLKAYRADIVKNVPLYSEMHRFIPAMLSVTGARIAEIKVRHHARRYGHSKYGLSRIYKVLLDLLTIKCLISFAARPMLWFGLFSVVPLFIGMFTFALALKAIIVNPSASIVIPLGLSTIFGALFIFLIFCGVLGELIYKTGDLKVEQLSNVTTKIS